MKKLIVIGVAAVLGAVVFMPEITTFAAQKAFEKENRDKTWAPRTAYRAAKINLRFFRFKTAGQMLGKSLNAWPKEVWAPEATFQLALCTEKQGKPKEAVPLYQDFIKKYPSHPWKTQAEKRVSHIKANEL